MQVALNSRYTQKRVWWLLVSTLLIGLTNGVLVSVDLGQNPLSGFCLGLGRLFGVGVGPIMLAVNVVLLGVVLLFDRSHIGLGMLMNMILVGYITDFSMWICSNLLPPAWFQVLLYRYLLLFPALAIFTVCIGIYLAVELGDAPYDTTPSIIADKLPNASYRTVRLIWDLSYIAVGTLLGVRLGVATVLMGFLLAPVITIVRSRFSCWLY